MSEPGAYVEPPRTYRSVALLSAFFVAGFAIDLALSVHGAMRHLPGWLIAAVLVIGLDALGVRVLRRTHTLTVDADAVRVGDVALARTDVVAASPGAEPDVPVLGWLTGLPRGMQAITVRTADDRAVALPTRHPDRLVAALGLGGADADEVRLAESDDLALLGEIDERAATVFRVAGYELPNVPIAAPSPDVTTLVIGRPAVGFAELAEVDGVAYLHELAVLPGRMRQGLGTALLDAACDWARAAGYPAITLTTFAELPFNAPFYARRGFVPLDTLPPGLAAVRAHEREVGMDDPGPRIAMRREL